MRNPISRMLCSSIQQDVFHIDEDMMQELENIKANVNVDATVLVVDAMTGQDAVNVAQNFSDKLALTV